MYTGKNPSALRSQKWLARSLIRLMAEKPFRKISIQELTERSKLSRQTFYQLFDSKEDIIEYYIARKSSQFLRRLTLLKIDSIEEFARLNMQYVDRSESFIQQLVQNNLLYLLERNIYESIDIFRSLFLSEREDPTDDYEAAFISSGMVGLLLRYTKDKSLTVDQLTMLMDYILNGFHAFYLKLKNK